jgi:stage II sporulation protein D
MENSNGRLNMERRYTKCIFQFQISKIPLRISIFLFLFIGLFPLSVSALNVSIRIYCDAEIKSVIISPEKGKYLLMANGKKIDTLTSKGLFQLSASGDSIIVKSFSRVIGKYLNLWVSGTETLNRINIHPLNVKLTRIYDDDVNITAKGGMLQMINKVDFEKYVAGVVECEAGYKKPFEFYKVQAIICRTYAFNNLARHITDKYELCDMIHCQVYHGAAALPDIITATEATNGIVVTDNQYKLINAAFYCNCGGYTLNSEDVWSQKLPYLQSVRDTFCIHQLHATWEKHISKAAWENYFTKKEKVLKCNIPANKNYQFTPIEKRVYYYDKGYIIPLKEIRNDFMLPSTYFTVQEEKDSVILCGKGNGHRVGLCQEGAINMASMGYSYFKILHFYYKDVLLLHYSQLPEAKFN